MMKLIFAGIAVAALAVACGGDDSSPETSTPAVEETATEAPTPGTFSPQATPTTASQDPTVQPTASAAPFDGSADPAIEIRGGGPAVTVVDVRAAIHDGFDRIVFEFEGDVPPGYEIRYTATAAACGSGEPVSLPGAAILTIEIQPATGHTNEGESTVDVHEINLGGAAITKSEQTCDFEALFAWAVGVTGERPFRVFELSEPMRLVIDIATP